MLGVSGEGGGELYIRVGRLFRVTLNVGTGAGRVTLADGGEGETTQSGGRQGLTLVHVSAQPRPFCH
jgi:hypothetical protein